MNLMKGLCGKITLGISRQIMNVLIWAENHASIVIATELKIMCDSTIPHGMKKNGFALLLSLLKMKVVSIQQVYA